MQEFVALVKVQSSISTPVTPGGIVMWMASAAEKSFPEMTCPETAVIGPDGTSDPGAMRLPGVELGGGGGGGGGGGAAATMSGPTPVTVTPGPSAFTGVTSQRMTLLMSLVDVV